jgi:hypothetical protein
MALYGAPDPAVQLFLQSGLRGLDRKAILQVEAYLQKQSVRSYLRSDRLKSDLSSYFEVQCLKYQSNCHELLTWWSKNAPSFLDHPQWLELIAEKNYSVRQLAELVSSQFYLQVGKTKSSSWRDRFAWLFHPRTILATAGAVGVSVSAKIFATIYNAATLGTMMRLWNAYTDAAVAPIEAHLKQGGTRDLAPIAVEIQEWLIRRSKLQQEFNDLKTHAEVFERALNSDKLDRETATRLWQEFQSYFFGKFMAFNQSLPGNMREGRAFIYATEFSEPLAIANFLSGRYDSYRQSLREIEKVQTQIDHEKSSSTVEKNSETLKKLHEELNALRQYGELQKRQLAGGLAVFLIRKYMYRDDVFRSVFDKDKSLLVPLDRLQNDLIESLGIQFFLKEFISQVHDVFRQYDLVFQAADVEAAGHLHSESKRDSSGRPHR